MKIFISYSREDSEVVERVSKELKEKNFDIFNADYINSGENFADQIITLIEKTDIILFFYSNHSASSVMVRREIDFALSKHKKVIPVLFPSASKNEWFLSTFENAAYPVLVPDRMDQTAENIVSFIHPSSQEKIQKILQETAYEPDEWDDEEILNRKKSYSRGGFSGPSVGKGGCCLIELLVLILIGGGIHWLFFTSDTSENAPEWENDTISIEEIVNITGDTIASDSVAIGEDVTAADSSGLIIAETDTAKTDSVPNKATTEEELPQQTSPESNYNWIAIILAFLAGSVCTFLLTKIKRNRTNLKVGSDTASRISIDGEVKSEIAARGVYSTHLDKGEYLVDIEETNKSNRHQTYSHTVNSNQCKLLYAKFEEDTEKTEKTIKCFIAGSKALQAERDALRAVTSIMYNKWASKKFRILSYTFEDFERAVVLGGQQQKYNNFIVEEANWALFIINGQVGSITLEEYRKAMNSYKLKGTPKILVMAQKGVENSQNVIEIKREIDKEKQYWNDYQDLNEMKHIFESTLNWDLIEMFNS